MIKIRELNLQNIAILIFLQILSCFRAIESRLTAVWQDYSFDKRLTAFGEYIWLGRLQCDAVYLPAVICDFYSVKVWRISLIIDMITVCGDHTASVSGFGFFLYI